MPQKTTQYDRVLKILESSEVALTLNQIHRAIRHRFKKTDAETAISARIRDIRHDYEALHKGSIIGRRVAPGKYHHEYQLQLTS